MTDTGDGIRRLCITIDHLADLLREPRADVHGTHRVTPHRAPGQIDLIWAGAAA